MAGSRVGLYFEMADHAGVTADRLLTANDTGWESAGERRTLVPGLADQPLRYSPLWAAFSDAMGVRGHAIGELTAQQRRVIATPVWHSSQMYDRHVRPTLLGEAMLSAVWVPRLESWSVWSLVTDRSDPPQTRRHERLARLMHRQVAPLIGTTLSTWRDRTVSPLTIVRRHVLEALLDGRSEPDIAADLSRSRSAVHEHVTALYRHFGVHSRAELAAFFLRRRPIPAGSAARRPALSSWLDGRWRRSMPVM